ncbi:MAG: hypothetical protein WCP39_01080 [Chlamydiota bacterium]
MSSSSSVKSFESGAPSLSPNSDVLPLRLVDFSSPDGSLWRFSQRHSIVIMKCAFNEEGGCNKIFCAIPVEDILSKTFSMQSQEEGLRKEIENRIEDVFYYRLPLYAFRKTFLYEGVKVNNPLDKMYNSVLEVHQKAKDLEEKKGPKCVMDLRVVKRYRTKKQGHERFSVLMTFYKYNLYKVLPELPEEIREMVARSMILSVTQFHQLFQRALMDFKLSNVFLTNTEVLLSDFDYSGRLRGDESLEDGFFGTVIAPEILNARKCKTPLFLANTDTFAIGWALARVLLSFLQKESLPSTSNPQDFFSIIFQAQENSGILDGVAQYFLSHVMQPPNLVSQPLSFFIFQFLHPDSNQRIKDKDMVSLFDRCLAEHKKLFL